MTNVANDKADETRQPLDNKEIKPNLEQLQQMNEETVKVRLCKLTTHTGIAPDKLYRCPIASCGGFFSVYELWLKHMKLRHLALECECPHCPRGPAASTTMISLDSFRLHFENHRRHTFLCLYCTYTCTNEQAALQHAHQEHSNFGSMRFEQIRFNVSYSYSIMLQNCLFPKREDFINELLMVLEKRLIDMEAKEKQKLKYQWPLSNNLDWLEDYSNMLGNRNVNLRCLIPTCGYRTTNKTILLQHLNSSHKVSKSGFSCSTCNYRLEPFSYEAVYNHIKTHTTSLFICTACSFQSLSRSKLSSHIRDQHAVRDVAVVHLFTVDQQIFHKIFIVFANNCLTFSTMKNCFCCMEKNMSGSTFNLHLKRYHNLVLNYYCEVCKNFLFKSLNEVKEHFEGCLHNDKTIKIRCELSAQKDLCVVALNEFQVQISGAVHPQKHEPLLINIKEEPNDSSDDCVILLEDDDIAIENSLKDKTNVKEIPKLKCISIENLTGSTNKKVVPQTIRIHQQIIEPDRITLPPNGINGYNTLRITSASNTNDSANNVWSTITILPTLPNQSVPMVAANVTTSNTIVNNNTNELISNHQPNYCSQPQQFNNLSNQ